MKMDIRANVVAGVQTIHDNPRPDCIAEVHLEIGEPGAVLAVDHPQGKFPLLLQVLHHLAESLHLSASGGLAGRLEAVRHGKVGEHPFNVKLMQRL